MGVGTLCFVARSCISLLLHNERTSVELWEGKMNHFASVSAWSATNMAVESVVGMRMHRSGPAGNIRQILDGLLGRGILEVPAKPSTAMPREESRRPAALVYC